MTSTTTFEKSIRYDRETGDYRGELDGQLIGFYPSYHAAEVALDQVAYDRLADEAIVTADIEADRAQAQADAAVDVLSAQDALAILDEINAAERRRAHYAAQSVPTLGFETTIAEGRAWLARYGYKTRLSARTGAYVPDGHGHGWMRVTGQRVQIAETPAAEACPFCEDGVMPNGNGTGELSGGWADVCDTCGGSGKLMPLAPIDPPADPDPGPEPWPTCRGTGFGPCDQAATVDGYCPRCAAFLDKVFIAAMTDRALDVVRPAPDSVQAGQEAFERITLILNAPRQPAERFSVTLRSEPARVVSSLAVARECPICGGDHHVQRCPRIWLELRRPVERKAAA